MTARVFLVPGFFGFTNLGDFPYFSHFHVVLSQELGALGIDAAVMPLDTLPTASIGKRAKHLLGHIVANSADDDDVHIVGHSTGGIDGRFLVASGTQLEGRAEVIDRVRTVVSVSSPHRGAPVAAFFTSLLGQKLLMLLSLSTVHMIRLGSVPLPALVALGGAVAQTGALEWASGGVLDQLFQQVLADFSPDRRREIQAYFDQAYRDQTLLAQLTPESMELLDALATPADGVRVGSVITAAPRPTLGRQAQYGLNPTWHAMYLLYRGLHMLSSTTPRRFARQPKANVVTTLERSLGWRVDHTDSDGMVPVLSQLWGELIHVARADHLDVMGHFHGPGLHPKHVDWLRTGSNFGEDEFRHLIASVARFIAGR